MLRLGLLLVCLSLRCVAGVCGCVGVSCSWLALLACWLAVGLLVCFAVGLASRPRVRPLGGGRMCPDRFDLCRHRRRVLECPHVCAPAASGSTLGCWCMHVRILLDSCIGAWRVRVCVVACVRFWTRRAQAIWARGESLALWGGRDSGPHPHPAPRRSCCASRRPEAKGVRGGGIIW